MNKTIKRRVRFLLLQRWCCFMTKAKIKRQWGSQFYSVCVCERMRLCVCVDIQYYTVVCILDLFVSEFYQSSLSFRRRRRRPPLPPLIFIYMHSWRRERNPFYSSSIHNTMFSTLTRFLLLSSSSLIPSPPPNQQHHNLMLLSWCYYNQRNYYCHHGMTMTMILR